jgi:hypothetical protein
MTSPDEMALDILILAFVVSGFVMCVGCTSAILKKCYDKYVLNLPDTADELSSTEFQNLEGRRYARAAAVIVAPSPSIEFTEVVSCDANEDVQTNPIGLVATVV